MNPIDPHVTGRGSSKPSSQQLGGATRRLLIGSSIAVLVVAAALIAWRTQTHRQDESGRKSASAGAQAAAGGQLSSMRGMNMPGTGIVHLTANQMRHFGVTFGTVEERTLENSVRTVGVVTAAETKLTDVTLRVGGYVERLDVDATGQEVSRGQPLMAIYSPELVAAEQELLVAAKLQRSIGEDGIPGVVPGSPDLVDATRRRFALWDISDAQVEAILKTRQAQRLLTLYAPASGIVIEKQVVQGQSVQPGQTLYRIANLDTVWIDVAVRERDAGRVRIGSRATVELTAYPERRIIGRVGYVYPTLDATARTVRARIEVPNAAGRLKPGMYATVTLLTPARRTLTVPTPAVLNTGERSLVFMDMGGGQLMPMDVVTGQTTGAYTEVRSGLEAGQRVVTSAQYLLDSEANLAEVVKSMLGQVNMSDMNQTGNMQDMPGMDMSRHSGGTQKSPNARTDSTVTRPRRDSTRGGRMHPDRR